MTAAIGDAQMICLGAKAVLGTGSEKEGVQTLEDLAASRGGSKFLVYQAQMHVVSAIT